MISAALACTLLGLTAVHAQLQFGGHCESGTGVFVQYIGLEEIKSVGIIPPSKRDVYISLSSPGDVDIQLVDISVDPPVEIIAYPDGLIGGHGTDGTFESIEYGGVTIKYSGYGGFPEGEDGNEYIEIVGDTDRKFEMRAFGYTSGDALVEYSWEAVETCREVGSGAFEQFVDEGATTVVGIVPESTVAVEIVLDAGEVDVDVQLIDVTNAMNPVEIIAYPSGIYNGASAVTLEYEGMSIEYSGYNGIDGYLGKESIMIKNLTTRTLEMRAYGYKAGNAQIEYSWGQTSIGDECNGNAANCPIDGMICGLSDSLCHAPGFCLNDSDCDSGAGCYQFQCTVGFQEGWIEECQDIPQWESSYGKCDIYEKNDWCAPWGDDMDLTNTYEANEGCCVCGGGNDVFIDPFAPTSNPTPGPTAAPTTLSPTANPTQNPSFTVDALYPGIRRLITFEFKYAEGESKLLSGREWNECDPSSNHESDSVGSFALGVLRQANGGPAANHCWDYPEYSDGDYVVSPGIVESSDGRVFESYRVKPATNPAGVFVASRTGVWYKFPTKELDYHLYTFQSSDEGGTFHMKQKISRQYLINNWNDGGFIRIPVEDDAFSVFDISEYPINQMPTRAVYVVVPSAVGEIQLSPFPFFSNGVQAAKLPIAQGRANLYKFRYAMALSPFDPVNALTTDGFDVPLGQVGPSSFSNVYGTHRRFFPVTSVEGEEGVVWQSAQKGNHLIFVTWFTDSKNSLEVVELNSNVGSYDLIGAVSQPAGTNTNEIIYLTVQRAVAPHPSTPTQAWLRRVNSMTGATIFSKRVPTGASDIDMHAFTNSQADMAWANGKLGVALGKTQTLTEDGMNHQAGGAYVFDPATLALTRNAGQTSSHSFDNSVVVSSSGDFLGVDLGDNFPRGINMWRFDHNADLRSKVVYTFKAKHGQVATNPAGTEFPVYDDITTPGKTFYKWSNDNQCYTELAHKGVIETSTSVLVFFIGEDGGDGPLDSSNTAFTLNGPRNVGFVRVSKNIESDQVYSQGATEEGGYYDFEGEWKSQQNKGVQWLTNSQSAGRSAARLKAQRVTDGAIVLLWEWFDDSTYLQTSLMVVDDAGNVIIEETLLSSQYEFIRLGLRDDLRFHDGQVIFYSGHQDGFLDRFAIKLWPE